MPEEEITNDKIANKAMGISRGIGDRSRTKVHLPNASETSENAERNEAFENKLVDQNTPWGKEYLKTLKGLDAAALQLRNFANTKGFTIEELPKADNRLLEIEQAVSSAEKTYLAAKAFAETATPYDANATRDSASTLVSQEKPILYRPSSVQGNFVATLYLGEKKNAEGKIENNIVNLLITVDAEGYKTEFDNKHYQSLNELFTAVEKTQQNLNTPSQPASLESLAPPKPEVQEPSSNLEKEANDLINRFLVLERQDNAAIKLIREDMRNRKADQADLKYIGLEDLIVPRTEIREIRRSLYKKSNEGTLSKEDLESAKENIKKNETVFESAKQKLSDSTKLAIMPSVADLAQSVAKQESQQPSVTEQKKDPEILKPASTPLSTPTTQVSSMLPPVQSQLVVQQPTIIAEQNKESAKEKVEPKLNPISAPSQAANQKAEGVQNFQEQRSSSSFEPSIKATTTSPKTRGQQFKDFFKAIGSGLKALWSGLKGIDGSSSKEQEPDLKTNNKQASSSVNVSNQKPKISEPSPPPFTAGYNNNNQKQPSLSQVAKVPITLTPDSSPQMTTPDSDRSRSRSRP